MNGSLEQIAQNFPALEKLGKNLERDISVVHQTMATDCGAACLAMTLGWFGKHVTLEQVRQSMQVGRDGVSARAIVECAGLFGLMARGVRIEVADLEHLPKGSILYLDFSHFVVFDHTDETGVHIADPAIGRRTLSIADANKSFTGVAITFEKAAGFTKSAKPENPIWRHLKSAVIGTKDLPRIAVVSVLLQLMSLLFPLVEGRFADRVLPRNDMHLLGVLLAGMVVTVLFYMIASITRSQLLLYVRTKFDAKLTLGFVDHMLRLPYDFFERRQVGDLQMRVGSVATVRETLTGAVLSGMIDGVLVLSHLVFLVFMSVKMTLVAVGIVALQAIVFVLSRKKLLELAGGSLAKQAEAASSLNELLVGMESLKASGNEHAASQQWAGQYVDVMNINLRKGYVQTVSESLLGVLNIVGPMGLLVAGTFDVLDHQMSLGTMLSANAMAVGFVHPMMSLIGTLQSLIQIKVHLNRIDDVLSTATEQPGATKLAPRISGEIVLDRVSFRYGPKLPLVVNEVSLRIRPGEFVAIVGSSGSGKTTLGRLLLSLYAPSSGNVRFDGITSAQIDPRSLRRQLGVVVQRPHIFGSTVRANIALADPSVSLEQVQCAAQLACIHDDVTRMPMQYETPIVAGGASLSGGQRQRVALARALVHQPAVLLLDEATSALDALTELAVQQNLDRLPCTRILIAHRLSTVIHAHRILVMENGRIVEQGTHKELLAKNGAYAKLVAAQIGEGAVSSTRAADRALTSTRAADRALAQSGERPARQQSTPPQGQPKQQQQAVAPQPPRRSAPPPAPQPHVPQQPAMARSGEQRRAPAPPPAPPVMLPKQAPVVVMQEAPVAPVRSIQSAKRRQKQVPATPAHLEVAAAAGRYYDPEDATMAQELYGRNGRTR